MTVTRLAGPGAGGSTPGCVLPWLQGWVCAGQGAWGRALIRSQAAMMAGAQGQVAAILRRRGRPPRVSRAAAWKSRRRVFGSARALVAVEGEVPEPGQQGRGDQGRGQPRGVDRQRLREMPD